MFWTEIDFILSKVPWCLDRLQKEVKASICLAAKASLEPGFEESFCAMMIVAAFEVAMIVFCAFRLPSSAFNSTRTFAVGKHEGYKSIFFACDYIKSNLELDGTRLKQEDAMSTAKNLTLICDSSFAVSLVVMTIE